jgi:hypothetical protein
MRDLDAIAAVDQLGVLGPGRQGEDMTLVGMRREYSRSVGYRREDCIARECEGIRREFHHLDVVARMDVAAESKDTVVPRRRGDRVWLVPLHAVDSACPIRAVVVEHQRQKDLGNYIAKGQEPVEEFLRRFPRGGLVGGEELGVVPTQGILLALVPLQIGNGARTRW